MNNEIGRKITSLTLMTIMLAGGMTLAAPGMVPVAHAANANLFVSAENSQFDNYMSGPQVIEVVVIDSDINDTDESKGEPDVTVNGKVLRMAQAVDGNWYGYFADRDQAQIADSTIGTSVSGTGLDFGTFCTSTDGEAVLGFSTSDTSGFAIPSVPATFAAGIGVNGSATGGVLTVDCSAVYAGTESNGTMNVVREAKELNTNPLVDVGQIGFGTVSIGTVDPYDGVWPFVQLYQLNPTGNVDVQYNKGGGAQSVTLGFDTVEGYAGITLDRATYPTNAQVHATITDLWLNIDPTDEDSWTWGTGANATAFYQLFDENGNSAGDGNYVTGTGDIVPLSGSLMCEDNCILLLDTDAQDTGGAIVTINDNDDSELTAGTSGTSGARTATIAAADQPVTFTEQGVKSGIFANFDENDVSVIQINGTAPRGTSATIDYNESPVSIVRADGWADVQINPIDDEWNSGEEIPIVIIDTDLNKNSHTDEDLDLFNPDVFIPALSTGDPFTLGEATSTPQIYIHNTTGGASAQFVGASIGTVVVMQDLTLATGIGGVANNTATVTVQPFEERAIINNYTSVESIGRTGGLANVAAVDLIIIDLETTLDELQDSLVDTTGTGFGANFINIDIRSITTTSASVDVGLINVTNGGTVITDATGAIDLSAGSLSVIPLLLAADPQTYNTTDVNSMNEAIFQNAGSTTNPASGQAIGLVFQFPVAPVTLTATEAIVVDFFSFGFTDDGVQASERIANQIVRIEAEEDGVNTSKFVGSLEYVMVNQLNIIDADTFAGISPIANDPSFIVIEDLTDEDAPRATINDLGADGVVAFISDQEEAPSHSGVVSFNADSYKIADTVEITLEDLDLNVDSDLIDIYTTVTLGPSFDVDNDQVGSDVAPPLDALTFGSQGRLLDVTFDDAKWTNEDLCAPEFDDGLGATGFTLVETDIASGVFFGDFEIPPDWCRPDGLGLTGTVGTPETTTGLDIEVNYVDYRDASGEIIEVGDSAGVRANTGSVSLDRTVYPVPFGVPADFLIGVASESPSGRSVFPIHSTGLSGAGGLIDVPGEFLVSGDLTVHIRVNDPDFDVNPVGEDNIAANTTTTGVGPVKISVLRGSDSVVLGYAGGPAELDGAIDVDDDAATSARQFGPISEIAPAAGIFELDLGIRYTDGPASATCPDTGVFENLIGGGGTTAADRFDFGTADTGDYCILQGDILQVEYTDPADASGDENTVTDSATFDLRNGVLQSDKSVYIIGSDMILTLIEPDFDLDNDGAETYDLDLIEWDSDASTTTMGDSALTAANTAAFDPEPTDFRETGDSTGIFQIVIEIPEILSGDSLERGEEIILEYTDWGPSGSDYVGDEDEDVNITLFTSNFGATVELDQKVYTWTDKVYITIVAPDHNFDGDLVDEIGNGADDPIKVSTRGSDLDNYKLVETGTDTGIFTGEVILTGFAPHDADGDGDPDDATGAISLDDGGPTDGLLPADDDDGLTVSFEFSEDETVVGSSLIRWNIGETQWLEASYPASGTGVVRVIDPDMNLSPEAVDNFDVDVWSDSDAGGIDLTVTETNEATGIFEGTVFFTVTDESSGHRLRVAEGDTVTAEYEDNTLPDPYTTADELDITATSLIGTVVPPLERAPAANLRTVDAFGNSLDAVSVDQQVQISADLANGQDREQAFAYLVQIQDGNGVTVSLAWITGSLSSGQSFSPALSWIPTDAGTYTATAFVWESVDNPTALSPPVSTTVNVS